MSRMDNCQLSRKHNWRNECCGTLARSRWESSDPITASGCGGRGADPYYPNSLGLGWADEGMRASTWMADDQRHNETGEVGIFTNDADMYRRMAKYCRQGYHGPEL